jgi:four helix bundle protein
MTAWVTFLWFVCTKKKKTQYMGIIVKEADVIYGEHPPGSLQRLSVDFSRAVRCWALVRFARSGLDSSAVSQLYRSGTSVGANVREAQYAESKKDFIHKLKIAEKELGEFFFWFGLIKSDQSEAEDEATKSMIETAGQVRRLLIAIIVKAKQNINNPTK